MDAHRQAIAFASALQLNRVIAAVLVSLHWAIVCPDVRCTTADASKNREREREPEQEQEREPSGTRIQPTQLLRRS